MKDQINYQQLFELENDIENLVNASPAFRLFNREKIRRFVSQNQHRLSVMHSTMDRLRDTYVKKDEKGKPMVQDVEGGKEWVFEDDDTNKVYLDEMNAFMSVSFDLHV